LETTGAREAGPTGGRFGLAQAFCLRRLSLVKMNVSAMNVSAMHWQRFATVLHNAPAAGQITYREEVAVRQFPRAPKAENQSRKGHGAQNTVCTKVRLLDYAGQDLPRRFSDD
jgi:hypothetical protein